MGSDLFTLYIFLSPWQPLLKRQNARGLLSFFSSWIKLQTLQDMRYEKYVKESKNKK